MRLSCFLFLLLFSFFGFSQTNELDSLEILLPQLKQDTQKVIVLNRLARLYRNPNPSKSTNYGQQALTLSKKIDYPKGRIDANYQIGVSYKQNINVKAHDSLTAIHLKNSINEAKKQNFLGLAARAYTAVGNSNISIDQKIEAIENALKYAKAAKDEKRTIRAMYSLALSHRSQKNSRESIVLMKEAIKKAEDIKYNSLLAQLYSTIGNMIQAHETKDNFLLAEEYGDKALSMVDKNTDPYRWAGYAHNAIIAKAKVKKLKEALFLAQEGKRIYKLFNDPEYVIFDNKIAVAYTLNDQARKAIPYFLSSLQYPQYGNTESDLRYISECYGSIKNYEQAYFYADSARILNSISYQNLNAKIVAQFNTKYKASEKETKIAQQELLITQEKNNKTKIIYGSLLALLTLTSLFFWYNQQQKRKKRDTIQALEIAKEKAKNIQKLDQLKDQFFTNISHELRTPLTLITDPLNKVLQKPISDLDHDDIELAYKNSHKLLSLINEIMDLSKLDAGKVKIKHSTININNALRRQFMAFDSLANIRNIKLKYVSKVNKDIHINTDYKKLEKIINNLVSNAIKFSNINGNITLSVSIENSDCIISVQDEGQGISADDQQYIFNRFYQGKQSNYQGGTGVGLALSKELSTLLGGNITVKSSEERGSTFTLTLPYNNLETILPTTLEESKNIVKTIQYDSLLIDGEKPKILIVEDNEDMSAYLYKIMSTNYQCSMALNAGEALKAMQTDKFELILSDVMMPGMNGHELRKKSIKIFKHEAIPYVFLTAKSMEDDILEGLRLGVDDYIIKPFNSDELKARVHNLIKNKTERDNWNLDNENNDKQLNDAEDVRFLKDIEKIILRHISDSSYSVQFLASDMALSSRQLGRRTKEITGLTPVAFILEMRLQKARQLIERKTFNNLNDIRNKIGIESNSYFSKKYKERFGISPRELIKK